MSFAQCLAIYSFSDPHFLSWNSTLHVCVISHKSIPNQQNININRVNWAYRELSHHTYPSNLSHLTTLSLQGNSLYGRIPATIGELSELTFINMSCNKLGGNILASIQGCWSLETIDLDSCCTRPNDKLDIPLSLWEQPHWSYTIVSFQSDKADRFRIAG